MSRKIYQEHSRINRLGLLAGLLAGGLGVSALAQSVPFPTYQVGPQTNGTFVVSDGTIIAPAGTQVNLGIRVRAKAIALNPTGNHTAAVLVMGTSGSNGKAVEVFNTQTGAILQTYEPAIGGKDPDGSNLGITYTPDGKYLLFSQDGNTFDGSFKQGGFVGIASVSPTTGMLSDYAHVSVAMDVDATLHQTTVTCFPNSPGGTNGSFLIPCGYSVSAFSNEVLTSYPTGIAVSSDAKTAYVVLDNNNTLTKIDLTASTPVEGAEVRVGNVPHSVVISPDGKTAYVSNEAGRIAKEKDFQGYSNGTPVVAAFPTGSTSTGTVSVVDLASFKVTGSIETGLHPTGMALWGKRLLVANTYSDTLSVIDTNTNKVEREINLGLPIGVPGEGSAYGAGPNSIAVDEKNNIAYVALYNANAIDVVDLNHWGWNPILGLIPVGYAPASVVLDTADKVLLIANDKGWGTTGNPNPFAGTVPDAPLTADSETSEFGVTGLETHQDLGTVSIVPVPSSSALWSLTEQVFRNNHWDLAEDIFSAAGGNRHAKPQAIPNRIGDPSKIKHVFLIIRENRTYDQILGDVSTGNGDASLAVFGDNATFGSVTPNAHELVKRFPLFDNFYDPSRQSADGHNWIVQAMAPYSDDIQSPDWLRDYPSNGGDAIAYQKKGHLWDQAAKQGVSFKNYGEYIEYNTFNPPQGCTPTNLYPGTTPPTPLPFIFSGSCEPLWIDFYNDVQAYESGAEKQLYNYNTVASHSPLPNLINNTVQNYPQFDLGIPDQFRFDIWNEDFQKDVNAGAVPQLEMIWISSDHTGGPPTAQAMQADNDLALGRFVDAISHSSIWKDSAIFIEEDDAQTGVDHVDGHRSPGYVVSPYVLQGGITDSTFYTQVNLTRTIEQILGLTPMNQFDLWAAPMRTAFIDDPPADNFKPWTHVPNGIPLTTGVSQTPTQTAIPGASASVAVKPQTIVAESSAIKALRVGWMKKKVEIFAGKYQKPDSEDPNTVNHLIWYEATNYTRPFPGEKKVLPASAFNKAAPAKVDDDD
ncbi:MAG: bifunctional YncE family protein/alkaline phosphatase family protein [Terracidiphilus sp.]